MANHEQLFNLKMSKEKQFLHFFFFGHVNQCLKLSEPRKTFKEEFGVWSINDHRVCGGGNKTRFIFDDCALVK